MHHTSFSRHRGNGHRRNGGRGRFQARRNNFAQPIHSSKYINKAVTEGSTQTAAVTHRFEDFQIDARLKQNIAARGYTTPTPIQDQVIPHVLHGRDVVGIANTGTGKTAAFLIPVLHKILTDSTQKALIVCPTRELAVQIQDEIRVFGRNIPLQSRLCIGGVHIKQQIFALTQHPSIVVGTPGRLKDLITRNILQLSQFQTVVLDEVDRMVDIGFIKDIKYIISFLPPVRQSLFFSATVSPQINGIIQSFLKSPVTVSVKVSETADRVEQDVIRVKSKDEKITTLHTLLKQEEFKKVLIFGRTKWNVEKLAQGLQNNGFLAASIHGNKSQNQRMRALTQFKQHQIKILVATDIAARGLDVEGISHVINFDEPATFDDYVHRIGRTGRAQSRGKALTFVL